MHSLPPYKCYRAALCPSGARFLQGASKSSFDKHKDERHAHGGGSQTKVGASKWPETGPAAWDLLAHGQEKANTVMAGRMPKQDIKGTFLLHEVFKWSTGSQWWQWCGGKRFQKQRQALILRAQMLSSNFLPRSSTCQGHVGIEKKVWGRVAGASWQWSLKWSQEILVTLFLLLENGSRNCLPV